MDAVLFFASGWLVLYGKVFQPFHCQSFRGCYAEAVLLLDGILFLHGNGQGLPAGRDGNLRLGKDAGDGARDYTPDCIFAILIIRSHPEL